MIAKDWEGSDFYKDLAISPDASMAQVKTAYREALRAYHPDLNSQSDQSERFQAITKAYAVLKDVKIRDLYDDYLFGSTEMPRRRIEEKKKNSKRDLLFRAAVFIFLLLLLKSLGIIGVQQQVVQDTSQTTTGINDTSGEIKNNRDSNQVLALMVGPTGPPGPAGVAGKDGFIGLNGYQGKDGIAGAPGKVGEQGATGPAGAQGAQGIQGVAGSGVVIVSLPSGDSNCANGGTKFVSSVGVISYACNGGGGSSGSLGTGYVTVGTCDASAKISLKTAYTSGQFKMTGIIVDELSGKCNGQTLTAVLKIKPAPISATGSPGYAGGDSYLCTTSLTLNPNSGDNANLITLTSANCKNNTDNTSNFNNIWALDVSPASDGLLLQIS
jgi:hypothetical protein